MKRRTITRALRARPISNRDTTAAPMTAGRVGQLIARANRWRDGYNPLRALTLTRVVSLLEAGERGEMADLQWTYRFIEKRGAVCRSLIVRRASALLKLDWDVKVPEELPPGGTPEMAERQRKTLRTWYDRIDNLREALRFLALAEFRGYSHLQIQSDIGSGEREAGFEAARGSSRLRLQPLHQWHWVRDGSCGQWGWNPEATPAGWASIPPEYQADPEAWGLIIREVAMPLSEIALVAHVRKALSQKDWDAFVEIYGIPGGVVIMPSGIPEGKESEYEDTAVKIAEGGSGALPNGASYEPNDSPRGENPFRDHIEYQDSELVLAGTGGKLTMLTESGSGTLAGTAHQSAFDDVAEGEAEEISEILQRQFDRRVLALEHPGEPQCAYWELAAAQNEDTDKLVDRVVKLAGVGLRASAEEISERTGLDLEQAAGSAALSPAVGAGQNPAARQDPEEDGPAGPIANRTSLEAAGVRQLAAAVQADLAPLVRRLDAIESISDPSIRRARLEALLSEWDSLQDDILADPEAAQAIARVQGAAMANGLMGRQRIANSDQPGHPFRGNQHTGGMGAGAASSVRNRTPSQSSKTLRPDELVDPVR